MVIERGKYRYSTDVGEIKSGKSVSALQENLSAAAEKTTQLPSGRFKGRGSKTVEKKFRSHDKNNAESLTFTRVLNVSDSNVENYAATSALTNLISTKNR